jgi:hypothetical protein
MMTDPVFSKMAEVVVDVGIEFDAELVVVDTRSRLHAVIEKQIHESITNIQNR